MKRLGQHFLINENKIKKIVEATELKDGDVIIEIGPGHGELTDEFRILNLEFRIIAIEKDERLAEGLRQKYSNKQNIEIITGDALKIIPTISNFQIPDSKFKLVGNIPYYITGFLLRTISELEPKPKLCVFTIQKEVAERIVARPPRMNLLAANVQFWAIPEIIDYILKKDFQPQPKVDSAIIKLAPTSSPRTLNPETYYKFIKILFKQPRKTILNNLAAGYENITREKISEALGNSGINPSDRPQNLNFEQIVGISKLLLD